MENAAAPRGLKKRWTLAVERGWCKGCAICVAVCPRQVLEMDEAGKAAVRDIGRCTGCLACELHCPDLAIEVSEAAPAGTVGAVQEAG